MFELLIVGGGKMGAALIGGLLAHGSIKPQDLAVLEALADRRHELETEFPGVTVTSQPVSAQAAVLAVKPADIVAAFTTLAEAGVTRVLSIAAGVSTKALEEATNHKIAVVRAMPNTPALVRQGASALAPGTIANESDLKWAEEILASVGTVERVPEALLDAVTGLSGSGPAYVFLMIESLIEGGVLAGIPRATASRLAIQTVLGAATLLAETLDEPAEARAAVTSPGGTTAAGLRALEEHATRSAFIEAVMAAASRSRELGENR